MTTTITQPTSQPTLTASDLFPDNGHLAISCWETGQFILRNHLTADQARRVLADVAPWSPDETRLIPRAIKTTWTRFTWHEDDCYETNADDHSCGCTDVDHDGPNWISHPANPLTRGALPVTWIYAYTPPPSKAELLAAAQRGIHHMTIPRDFSRPEENEPYLAGLRSHGWFDDATAVTRIAH